MFISSLWALMFKKCIYVFFFSKNNIIYVFQNFILVKEDICFLYIDVEHLNVEVYRYRCIVIEMYFDV